uniref:DUF5641 domain-containing protein n=1 Tax=Heterorhabditis bacteriophora TaxID=37862 RepID=A0A1I7X0P1_HETBA
MLQYVAGIGIGIGGKTVGTGGMVCAAWYGMVENMRMAVYAYARGFYTGCVGILCVSLTTSPCSILISKTRLNYRINYMQLKGKDNDIVLIFDPNQSRNSWKLGRVSKLTPTKHGDIRYAEVTLPNKRIIQRPTNLLIPLEIPDPYGTDITAMVSPSTTLHDYEVRWKCNLRDRITVISTTCPVTPFCTNIDCTLCTEMLANPSCWPKTAIVATGVIIYGLIISLYFLCYIPVILGSPIVMIAKGLGYSLWVITLHGIRQICLALTSISNYLYQQRQRRRRINLWTSIPIIMAVYSIQRATSCQEVDVFSIELACVELLVKSVRAHKSVQTGSMPRTLF